MKLSFGGKKSKLLKLPGTVIYTGDSDLDTKIAHYRYNVDHFEIMDDYQGISTEHRDLIVVEGFKNQPRILELTKTLNIDPFFVEDIFNVTQRNKFSKSEDQLFIVMKYAFIQNNKIDFRSLSIILKPGIIVAFTDYENNYVKNLLDRVQRKVALFPKYDESFVLYSIYDMVIDEQLEMAKELKKELDELEGVIMDSNSSLSKDLFMLHKYLVQLRNNVHSLSENLSPRDIVESELITDDLIPFVTDLEDHIYNLIEKLSMNIEICNSLITMYSTQISNRTNEVMKTLTIISVIFIPLSFIAGVFGMNFVKFDILQNQYGLTMFIVLSLMISLGMILWFKHKKWL